MHLGVLHGGLGGVMRRMRGMAVRHVGVMCRLLVIAGLMMLRSLAMMVGRILVVLGCGIVVLGALMS